MLKAIPRGFQVSNCNRLYLNQTVVAAVGVGVAVSNTIAGVVLAGGRSSRMGQNKAFMRYKNKPLVHHMLSILQETGLQNLYISGAALDGFRTIPDPELHQGPAFAMAHCLEFLHGRGLAAALFVPVDMPLLTPHSLQQLLMHERGAFYQDLPLPAFLPCAKEIMRTNSVKELLAQQGVLPVLPVLPEDALCMQNINTQQEWERLVRA